MGRSRSALSFVALGLGATFALGCGPSIQRCPAKGGAAWREVTSRHFVLQTDLREAEARATGDDLERLYTLLDAVVFPGFRGAGDRVNVVLFSELDDLDAFSSRPIAGWYQERSEIELERAPTIVMRGGPRGEARSIFLHELTHRLMHRTFGYIPTWFNEGFAEYFSTARVQDDRVVLGEVISGTHINAGFVPGVRDLVSANHDRFYGSESYRYYEGAWSLAHFLQNDAAVGGAFNAFVGEINGGAPIDVAWRKFRAAVGDQSIEDEFRAYLDRPAWQSHWRTVALPPASSVDQVRPMRDEEVHLRWARLFHESDVDAIREQLEMAANHSGDSTEARYWRACFALSQKKYVEAEAAFRAALASAPGEPRATYGLLIALERQDHPNAAELLELAHTLVERGTTPDQLNGAARVFLRKKYVAEADELVTRSLAIDPGYWRSLVTEARVRFAQGRAADAVDAQEKGMSHGPESKLAPALAEDLARYVAAADAQKRNASPPP